MIIADLRRLLSILLLQEAAVDLTLRLFINDLLPDEPVAADFTEPAGIGYAPRPLAPADWAVSAGVATMAEQLYEFTASLPPNGKIWGAWLTWSDSGDLVGYAYFDSPWIPAAGDWSVLKFSLDLAGLSTGGVALTEAGATALLNYLLGKTSIASLELGLYSRAEDFIPDRTATLGASCASELVEISGGGYARKSLAPGSWILTTSDAGARATYPGQIWTFTEVPTYGAGCDGVRGAFVVSDTGILLWYEEAPQLALPDATDSTYRVSLALELG